MSDEETPAWIDPDWMEDPAIKTERRKHQRDEYLARRDVPFWACHWKMGLGKSKLILDVASYLYLRGLIDAVVVVVPNSVLGNWTRNEVPVHLAADHVSLIYPKRDSDEHVLRRALFSSPDEFVGKLRFLEMPYEAIAVTDRAFKFLARFMRLHRCFFVLDECTAIKHGKSETSKRIKRLGTLAERRWELTGTPYGNSVFNIHSQIEFIDPEFWARHGMRTYGTFKSSFGVFEPRHFSGRSVLQRVGYQRLDHLRSLVKTISSRLTREDAGIVLPPRTFDLKTFEMTEAQAELYEIVRSRYVAELESGLKIDATMALTRLTRLHQILAGFVGAEEISEQSAGLEDFPEIKLILKNRVVADIVDPSENPRLQLLSAIREQTDEKMIVYCRFTREIEHICELLGPRVARYDGKTKGDRLVGMDRFLNRDSDCDTLVANVKSLSHGWTLNVATLIVYYSNTPELERREQSEDRNYRIGQTKSVHVVDVGAVGTVDMKQIHSLRQHHDVAREMNGDQFRDWIKAPPPGSFTGGRKHWRRD